MIAKEQKKLLFLSIQYLGLILSLWLLFDIIDISSLKKVFNSLPLYILLLGLTLALVRTWLMMERWILLSPKETALSRWEYFKLILASGSVNLFIPGALGADVVRSILVSRKAKESASSAFFSVYLDRLIGFSSILILGIFATFFTPELQGRISIVFLLIIMLFILATIVWLSRHQKTHMILSKSLNKMGTTGSVISKKLDSILNVLNQYRPSNKHILFAFILCLPIHTIWFTMVWLAGDVIGTNISFFMVTLVTILVWIITMVPLSIAGIGIRELSFVYLMQAQGVSDEQSTMMALFQSVIIIIIGIIGLPFLFRSKS